jgi:hypothetical protein
MLSNMLEKGYILWDMVKTCQKHIKEAICALKHGRKMLKMIYMLWNMFTMACLFCSNIPKTCQEGYAHFKTWLKYVGKT